MSETQTPADGDSNPSGVTRALPSSESPALSAGFVIAQLARALNTMPCSCTHRWNHNEREVVALCRRCRVMKIHETYQIAIDIEAARIAALTERLL